MAADPEGRGEIAHGARTLPLAVFVGASAGGIEATAELLASGANVLPTIFDRVGSLPGVTPADGETVVGGIVYVAPRGHHMLVADGNDRAKDLWGFDAAEVRGKSFLDLEIGMAVEQLREPLRAAATGAEPMTTTELPARDRRGREFSCRVRCAPMVGTQGAIEGAIVLMQAL